MKPAQIRIITKAAIMLAVIFIIGSPSQPYAQSQPYNQTKRAVSVDKDFPKHAGDIARACIGNWENEACLKATSQAAMVLISNYGSKLQQSGHKSSAEPLKQECAASTAATQEDNIPAYAMKSAYTVCANKIADISGKTGVSPDLSYYQLLVASVICMDKKPNCATFEGALKRFAK